MLYLESGALPISQIISIRRLSYLQTILKRPENEITKKIFRAQSKDPSPGDWVKLVQEDMSKYKIQLTEEEIVSMDKNKYKSYIKYKVRNTSFLELSQMKMGHKKVRNIIHMGLFGPKEYLKSDLFSNKIRKLLYNLRCKSVAGIPASFHTQYKENIFCPLHCLQEDTQEHILCCPELMAHLSNSEQKLLTQVNVLTYLVLYRSRRMILGSS